MPSASPSRSRRRRWIALAMLPLVLFAAYAAWWLYAVSAFRDSTIAWIEHRRADGWRLYYAEVSRRGFPLKLGLRFDQPVAGSPDGTWRWSASRALLSTPVLGSEFVRLAIKGDQTLEIASASGSKGRYEGRAGKLAFDILPGGWVPNGRLSVRDLAIDGEAGGESLKLHRLDLVSRGDPALASDPTISSYAAELSARGLRLSEGASIPLCREVEHLALDAKLLGGLDPGPWPASVAKWRDDGGVIEARRLALTCGPLTLTGEGTFAFDPAGQPIGAMTARIQGYEAALDRLAGDDLISAHAAATAKILLRAMARRDGDGAPILVAPVSIQDRTVSVGPVPLLRLPALPFLQGAPKTRPTSDK